MRTQLQIDKIKESQSPATQQFIFLKEHDIEKLLEHYNNHKDKVDEKPTGPKCLYIKEGEGVIDDLLIPLRKKYGNFKVRNAQIFDTEVPHVIHVDDGRELPNSYKAFTIPLQVTGGASPLDAKLCFFDQYYYGGPAKFLNGEDYKSPTYNQAITSYEEVEGINDRGISDIWRKDFLTHLDEKWIKGLSMKSYFPWIPGSYIAFDSLQLHCASDFRKVGVTRKIGLSIFTTL